MNSFYKRVLTDKETSKLSNQVAAGFTAYNFFKLYKKLIDRIQSNACLVSQYINTNQIELSEWSFGGNHSCFHCNNYFNSVTSFSYFQPFCFELTIHLILDQYQTLQKDDNISARLKQIIYSLETTEKYLSDWEFLKIDNEYKEVNFINIPISLGCFLDFILSKSPCDIYRISHLSMQNRNIIFLDFLNQINSYNERKQFIVLFVNNFC
jgi:hypothetical protein